MILDAKFKPTRWSSRIERKKSLGSDGEKNNNSVIADYDECVRNMNTFNVHATRVVYL